MTWPVRQVSGHRSVAAAPLSVSWRLNISAEYRGLIDCATPSPCHRRTMRTSPTIFSRAVRVLVVASLFTFLSSATEPSTAEAVGPRIAVVGDSLTYYANRDCGYTTKLQTATAASAVRIDGVIGREIVASVPPRTATTNTSGVLAYNSWVPMWNPDVVVVGLGTNDTRWQTSTTIYRSRIQSMLSTIGSTKKVVWVNIWRWDSTTGQKLATAFNTILQEEMSKLGTRGVIVDWASQSKLNRSWTVSDGIHDTTTGCNKRIAMVIDGVKKVLAA